MAKIHIIHEISNKASILLSDLGFSSEEYSISYGLQKSAHKFFYDDGIFEDVCNADNWGPNENYWGSKFQSIIAGAHDMTKTRQETFEFLFGEIKSFENWIKQEEIIPEEKTMHKLFSSIDQHVDLNVTNKNY